MDLKRNPLYLHVKDALTVITDESLGHKPTESKIVSEHRPQQTVNNKNQEILSWYKFNQWAGYSEKAISDKEFLAYMGLDGEKIPKWIKQNNVKWVKAKKYH